MPRGDFGPAQLLVIPTSPLLPGRVVAGAAQHACLGQHTKEAEGRFSRPPACGANQPRSRKSQFSDCPPKTREVFALWELGSTNCPYLHNADSHNSDSHQACP
jgi:hypothetical protein